MNRKLISWTLLRGLPPDSPKGTNQLIGVVTAAANGPTLSVKTPLSVAIAIVEGLVHCVYVGRK